MLKNSTLIAGLCTMLLGLAPEGEAPAQNVATMPEGAFNATADGWYEGRVRSLFVADGGTMRVLLTPPPEDSGHQCNGAPYIEASTFVGINTEEERWVKTRIYETFADALAINAQVSVYLEERLGTDGQMQCVVDRVQIWATPNSGTSATSPTGTTGVTPPTNPTPPTTPTTPPSTVRQYYGAFVVGSTDTQLVWFWGTNYLSQAAADDAVLRSCQSDAAGPTNCRIEARFGSGQCVAFAVSDGTGGWGLATGNSRSAAETGALQECRNAGNSNCSIRTTECNSPAGSSFVRSGIRSDAIRRAR
ncbi:MAG: DUF4189 domain-containing protein [Gammaproteobacteria bacterium]|nr:DUF4189 domain-containing protein [Gammaproteobacteria bacterium]MYF57786.1 DUF4189 domain-containing protein [Gammaproteobacteria bacterium]